MIEINKLRTRLKNIQKNVIEYRMTVIEAKTLLQEIDELLKLKEKLPDMVIIDSIEKIQIIDGGTF